MSTMYWIAWLACSACWAVWLYPFAFRAPHNQKRPSITRAAPTRAGLLLECLAIAIALSFRISDGSNPGLLRIAGFLTLGPVSATVSWSAVRHLGRQFRISAGLYEDHQLVRTGPYAFVRHPIYASLLVILLSTAFLMTPWTWSAVGVAMFLAGTEIRVRAEDRLLESRFGAAFEEYRRGAAAYIPWVR